MRTSMHIAVLDVLYRLTPRDEQLIDLLYDHATLSTPQIATAFFPSENFAQRRLRTLTQLKITHRFRHLKPDGGAYPYQHTLDTLGYHIAAHLRDETPPTPSWISARTHRLINRANLHHLSGTNGFFTDLLGHTHTHPDSHLDRWWNESHVGQTAAFADHGDSLDLRLLQPQIRPDGHGIFTEHDQTVAFFLEYDTGTQRPISILVDKLTAYEEFAKTSGLVWPVLFWLPDARREAALHDELARSYVGVPVATANRTTTTDTHQTPADRIWHPHHHPGGRRRLAELATYSTGLRSTLTV